MSILRHRALIAALPIALWGACTGNANPISGEQGIGIGIVPTSAEALPSGGVMFSATVTGTGNTSVLWSVQEGGGGGTVDAGGLYTAPASTGTFHVVVKSAIATSVFATATVTVASQATASAPSIAPGTTTSSIPINAVITCPNLGTLPYRTTDGSAPTTSSPQSGTATFTSSGQLRAICAGGGYAASAEASATYTIATLGFVPGDRITIWHPGIPGGIPNVATIHTTIDAATYGNGTTDATAAINGALAAAGAVATAASPRVVYLPQGTYRTTSNLYLGNSYVVLRGAGPALTKIRSSSAAMAIWFDGGSNWGTPTALAGNVAKGATSFDVASAAAFRVGDVIQIDQRDDPSYVFIFDSIYRKRAPGWTNSGPLSSGVTGHSGYRSVSEMHEITAISGNTVTISSPLRMSYGTAFAPQAWRVIAGPNASGNGIRWVGLEDLYVTGGSNDNIVFEQVAYGWLKNVESDGSLATGLGTTGHHINFAHCYRCEIRHAYVHHAREIVQGGGAYGIGLTVSSSECLVEDSIAVYLNKAILTEVSGGGNVFGYNYADNIKTSAANWMEGACNGSHDAFSHHDLWEGNWCANIGSDATHGSQGFLTFFRNYAAGRCSDAAYGGIQTDNVRAANSDAWNREMTFVGNVMFAYPVNAGGTLQPVYEISSNLVNAQPACIWRIGEMDMRGGGGTFDTQFANPGPNSPTSLLPAATYTTRAKDKLWRHGNWDSVTSSVADWQLGYDKTFPSSLYLPAKPAFFGAAPWPWVTSTGATAGDRVKTLPAKARYDAGTPNG